MEYIHYLAAALLVIFLLALLSVLPGEEQEPGALNAACKDNLERSCSVGPCNGTQSCDNGSWSRCSWEVVCKPNSAAPCEGSLCAGFHRICNVCGSGYGPCIESGKES